jgi:di/tricarboxylate transporter
MSIQLALVLLLLAIAIAMFALNRPRTDVVALLMMAALPLTGVISVADAIAGFADPNVVLIALLFVVGEGLVRTGVAQRLGDFVVARAGPDETRLLVVLMVFVAGVGSVMSSTGVIAIFIPIALRIARNSGIDPGRLMMPLSVAALISGMMTLVATAPNLVINGELVREGFDGFGFFAFTPFGAPLLVLAIVYMLVVRPWLGAPAAPLPAGARPGLHDWIEEYALAGREYHLRVLPGSVVAGRTLDEMDRANRTGWNLLAIERTGRLRRHLMSPQPTSRIEPGDILFADVHDPSLDAGTVFARLGLELLPLEGTYFSDHVQDIGMAEAVVPVGSPLVGRSVLESRLRSGQGVAVIGLKRGRVAATRDLLQAPLRAGDTLLVAGTWRAILALGSGPTQLIVINLPVEFDNVAPAASRAPWALLSLAVMVALMVSGWLPNVHAALVACLMMGLFGCVDMPSAYRSIHWQSVVLIAGMLPFSLALQATGGVDLAADALLAIVGDAGPRTVLAALFVVTALLGMFVSNTATAVLMAPVALGVAAHLQASPYPFAMTVALASSAAFMTPVSSPVNTLVVGPGNYRFMDFVRVGVPLTILTLATTIALVPWLLPF